MSRTRNPSATLHNLLTATVLAGAFLAGLMMLREVESSRIVDISRSVVAGKTSDLAITTAGKQCLGPCPVLAQVAIAAARNAIADRHPELRHELVLSNERDLAPWLDGDGARADALAQITQSRFILEGAASPSVISAYSASYAAGAYSISLAPWRVSAGASMWSSLTPDLRRQVLDEAIWARLVRPQEASLIDAAFRDPAASAALALRNRRVRGNEMHGVVARQSLGR